MSIGSAAGRRVSIVRQSGFAPASQLTPPVAAGSAAKTVRRSSTSLNLTRDSYQSNEKRTDRQKADSGLGTHKVTGTLDGEAFLGAWADIQESLLAKAWAQIASGTVQATSGDGFTFVGSTGVLTRAAGGGQSFVTDGLYEGLIVKPAALHASVNGKLAYLSAVSATSITLKFLDGTVGTDVSVADTDAQIVIPGKATNIPSSGFLKHFYQVEDYFSDIASTDRDTGDASSVFWNLFVNGGTFTIQSNNFVTFSADILGDGHSKDYEGADAPYSTSVTAAGTERAFRCSAIWLIIDGIVTGTITNGTIQITRNAQAPAVAGSNYSPDIIPGSYTVTMNITQLLESLAMRSKLRNEDEFKACVVMQAVSSTDFFAIPLPRLKLTSHSVDDNDALSETLAADGLKANTATGVLATTIAFQDSTLV